MAVPILALTLGTGGCLVTTSTYEAKTRESDSLREALASGNKEKTAIEAKHLAVQKLYSDEKAANETLSSRVREMEKELQALKEDLATTVKKYEGTRFTREELISELLEKEKSTGKRIQELAARAQACETEVENLRKEAVARNQAISDLEERLEEAPGLESLRRERDILLGRIERMNEERVQEARRRDLRFSELARALSVISPDIAAAPVGPAIRVLVPHKLLFRKGKTDLTDAGQRLIQEMGKAASEFPAASIVITAGGKSQLDEIRAFLSKSYSLPPERVLASATGRERETELLLVIP